MPLAWVGVVLATWSCDSVLEPPDHTYTGAPVVEFAPALPAGNYTMSVSVAANSTADQVVNVGVQYVGTPPKQAVSGTITLGSGTTAKEGTQFSVPSKSYTIPSGGYSTTIPFTIHGGGIANGGSVQIQLQLDAPGSGVAVSANYGKFTISIKKAAG